jgi:hypothetical protein
MLHYLFRRLSDDESIPLVADNDTSALALLGQRENLRLSTVGEGEPAYLFAKSAQYLFWCKPSVPVYRAAA